LSKAIQLAQDAIEFEQKGNLEKSLENYQRSLEMLMTLYKEEKQNENRKSLLKQKLEDLLVRAERIKSLQKQQQQQQQQSQEKRKSSESNITLQDHKLKLSETVEMNEEEIETENRM